jgi:hypothetical protein
MDLNEQLTAAISQAEGTDTTPLETEPTPPVTEQATETPAALEFDWTKDGRHESMWKGDPNNLYKSYKQIEPLYQTVSKYGIKDPDGLSLALDKYKEYTDPSNLYVSTYNQLEALMQHEKYGQKFVGALNEIKAEAERDRYGANLPPEVLQKLQQVEALEGKLGQFEQEKKKEQAVGLINENMGKIDEFAKSNGLEYDADKFLTYCNENQIPYNLMMAAFKDFVFDDVLNRTKTKAVEETVANIQKNKAAVIPSSNRTAPKTNEKTSLSDRLRSVLN